MNKPLAEYKEYCANRRKLGLPQPSYSNFLRMIRGKKVSYRNFYTTSDIRKSPDIPSVNSMDKFVGAKRDEKLYTGDKLLGIAVMHKSNSVPVFKKEDAEDIANMRRN